MKKALISIVILLLALAGGVYYCWTIRETPTQRREARKQVAKEFKECKDDGIAPFLRRLVDERFVKVRFNDAFPWLHIGKDTRVPIDFVGQLVEDSFLRFAGQGTPETANVKRIKEMLDFSEQIMPLCSESERTSLMERRVDACFFIDDFDGAIKLISAGLPGRSKEWTEGTVAKLRAHKAMAANDDKEVVKQLLIFDKYLNSKEMEDNEEVDQTTGIVYSIDWLIARNAMRISTRSRKIGDAATADKYLSIAKPAFAKALEKAQGEPKAIAEIKKEMSSYGL